MSIRSYSKEIAAAVNDFLVNDDWNFSFDDDKGLFRFNLSISCKLRRLQYIIDIKDDEYLVYAISPMCADEDDAEQMATMSEFINRANYGLKAGNFEIDFRDGEIRYKVHEICEDTIPTREIIKRSIHVPAMMFDRYGPGILDILFGGASAKEAVDKCEGTGSASGVLDRQMRSLLGEDPASLEGEDLDSMLARLKERVGDDEDDEDDDSADSDDE